MECDVTVTDGDICVECALDVTERDVREQKRGRERKRERKRERDRE